jgi:hypothetical protein
MTQDMESIVMEPVTNLVLLGSGGNAEPVDTSISNDVWGKEITYNI